VCIYTTSAEVMGCTQAVSSKLKSAMLIRYREVSIPLILFINTYWNITDSFKLYLSTVSVVKNI